jgi:hypothetical protein
MHSNYKEMVLRKPKRSWNVDRGSTTVSGRLLHRHTWVLGAGLAQFLAPDARGAFRWPHRPDSGCTVHSYGFPSPIRQLPSCRALKSRLNSSPSLPNSPFPRPSRGAVPQGRVHFLSAPSLPSSLHCGGVGGRIGRLEGCRKRAFAPSTHRLVYDLMNHWCVVTE